MYKLIIAVTLCLLSGISLAQPNQLDVIGIIPGVTPKHTVESKQADYGYIIGGYELMCVPAYIDNNILGQFTCFTGEKSGSRDVTKEKFTLVTNLEVHETLLKGFTRKFGKPEKDYNLARTTGFGVSYNTHTVEWRDKQGNKLVLMSMATKISEGALMLIAAEKVQQDDQEKKQADDQREF